MGIRTRLAGQLRRRGLGDLVDAVKDMPVSYTTRRDRLDMRRLQLLLRFWMRPDSNGIDIGANIGQVMQMLMESAPHGSHIAFEPLPELSKQLQLRFPTVDVREIALSNRAGTEPFRHVVEIPAMSGLYEQEYPKSVSQQLIEVTLERLDDALPSSYRPDVIKIDVEGAECDVIEGGLDVIGSHRPLLVVEHYAGTGSGPSSPERFHALLEGTDYDVLDIDGGGPYTAGEIRKIYDSRRLWTWIGRPRLRR